MAATRNKSGEVVHDAAAQTRIAAHREAHEKRDVIKWERVAAQIGRRKARGQTIGDAEAKILGEYGDKE